MVKLEGAGHKLGTIEEGVAGGQFFYKDVKRYTSRGAERDSFLPFFGVNATGGGVAGPTGGTRPATGVAHAGGPGGRGGDDDEPDGERTFCTRGVRNRTCALGRGPSAGASRSARVSRAAAQFVTSPIDACHRVCGYDDIQFEDVIGRPPGLGAETGDLACVQ